MAESYIYAEMPAPTVEQYGAIATVQGNGRYAEMPAPAVTLQGSGDYAGNKPMVVDFSNEGINNP